MEMYTALFHLLNVNVGDLVDGRIPILGSL